MCVCVCVFYNGEVYENNKVATLLQKKSERNVFVEYGQVVQVHTPHISEQTTMFPLLFMNPKSDKRRLI